MMFRYVLYWLALPLIVFAKVSITRNGTQLTLANNRLSLGVNTTFGAVTELYLDGQNLLGTLGDDSGWSTGVGPYIDCYCIPSGFWTPGKIQPKYETYTGKDVTGVPYGGIKLSDTHTSGITLEMFWFLREHQTGIHVFARAAYYNTTTPFFRNLQEFRTLMWPNTDIWTHLSANEKTWGPNPSRQATKNRVTVQDATWDFGKTQDDAYVKGVSNYFTKYTFQDTWRNHDVHGMCVGKVLRKLWFQID
jgi:rhamnogalacturonan endolyase